MLQDSKVLTTAADKASGKVFVNQSETSSMNSAGADVSCDASRRVSSALEIAAIGESSMDNGDSSKIGESIFPDPNYGLSWESVCTTVTFAPFLSPEDGPESLSLLPYEDIFDASFVSRSHTLKADEWLT